MSSLFPRPTRRAVLTLALATPFISRAHAQPALTDALGRGVALKATAERIVLGFN